VRTAVDLKDDTAHSECSFPISAVRRCQLPILSTLSPPSQLKPTASGPHRTTRASSDGKRAVSGNLHREPTLSLTSVPSAKIFSSHREKDRGSQWQAFNVSLEHRLKALPSILDFVQICKDEPVLHLPPRASDIVKLETPG
jgi:hypothetical protein